MKKYRIVYMANKDQKGFVIQRKFLLWWTGATMDEWDICAQVYETLEDAERAIGEDNIKSSSHVIKEIEI
jgi:hypothetical protein